MTRADTGEKVQLTLGSWVKIVVTCGGFVLAQYLGLTARLMEIECEQVRLSVAAENRERRLTALESRLEKQRDEWIVELRELRQTVQRQPEK